MPSRLILRASLVPSRFKLAQLAQDRLAPTAMQARTHGSTAPASQLLGRPAGLRLARAGKVAQTPVPARAARAERLPLVMQPGPATSRTLEEQEGLGPPLSQIKLEDQAVAVPQEPQALEALGVPVRMPSTAVVEAVGAATEGRRDQLAPAVRVAAVVRADRRVAQVALGATAARKMMAQQAMRAPTLTPVMAQVGVAAVGAAATQLQAARAELEEIMPPQVVEVVAPAFLTRPVVRAQLASSL